MSFSGSPPPDDDKISDDEKGVMHIGGPRGRQVLEITRWILLLLVIAGLMVLLFIRFGATTLWAIGLVGFMAGYMLLMGKWASGNDGR